MCGPLLSSPNPIYEEYRYSARNTRREHGMLNEPCILSLPRNKEQHMNKPRHFNQLKQRYPAYFEALETLGETINEAGPLDARTSHLVQLAAAAASRSEGAVHSHARRAQDAGASEEEIHHALLSLTSTIGFPAVSAALSWVDDLNYIKGE